MKKLFTESTKLNWTEDAVVGGRFVTEYSYAIGYWEAGDYLVERTKELPSSLKDRLFYPICFNYRQCIELVLKELIISTEKFYKKSEHIGYEIKKLTAFKSNEVSGTHSLKKLLLWLITALECVSDEVFDKDIRSLILELHNFDSNSQRFRYSTDKAGNPSFPSQQSYNLTNIKTEITRIINYLAGIDAWIDHYDGMANQIIETYNPS